MMSAFVFVQINVTGWDGMRKIHEALHGVPGVKTVHFLAGPTDVVLFVEGANQAGLAESIGKVRGVKGVASTDTRIVWPI